MIYVGDLMPRKHPALEEQMRALGASTSGFSLDDLTAPYMIAWRAASAMAKRGELHRGRASHKVVRFFGCAADALAFERKAHEAALRPLAKRLGDADVAPWDADAPIHYPTNADGSPAWKHTVAPARELDRPRYARMGDSTERGVEHYA